MRQKIQKKYIEMFKVENNEHYQLLLFKLFIIIEAGITSPIITLYSYIEGDYFLAGNLIISMVAMFGMLFLINKGMYVRFFRHFYLLFGINYIFLIYNFQNGGVLNTPLSWAPLIIVIFAIISRSTLSFIAHILFFLISNILLEYLIIKNSILPFKLKYVSFEFVHISSFFMATGSFLIFFYSMKILIELFSTKMTETINTRVQLNQVLREKVEIPLTQFYINFFTWEDTEKRRDALNELVNSIISKLNNVRFLDKLSSKKEILCVDMDLIVSDVVDLWEEKLSNICDGNLIVEGDLDLSISTNENNYNSYIVANIIKELNNISIEKIKIVAHRESDFVILKIILKLGRRYIIPSNFLITYDNMFKDLSLIDNGFAIAQIYASQTGHEIDYMTDKNQQFTIKSKFKHI